MRAQGDERVGFVGAGSGGSLLGAGLLSRTRDGVKRTAQGR